MVFISGKVNFRNLREIVQKVTSPAFYSTSKYPNIPNTGISAVFILNHLAEMVHSDNDHVV